MQCKQSELTALEVGEERSQKCKEIGELQIYLNNSRKATRKFYRKYMINELTFTDRYCPTFIKWKQQLMKAMDTLFTICICKH